MKYKTMKLMCMFDLPTETAKQKQAYRLFRKKLISEGFVMMQYSIYIRTCPNKEYAERMEKRLCKFLPLEGNIRLVSITEKQYDDMRILVGSKNVKETALGTERLVII